MKSKAGLLRSYKGLKQGAGYPTLNLKGTCLLRSYKGLKLMPQKIQEKYTYCLLRSYKGLKLGMSGY